MALQLIHRNVLENVVGRGNGLSDEDLGKLEERYPRIIKEFAASIASGEVGFPKVLDDEEVLAACEAFAIKRKGTYRHVIVIGMGGSSLGLKAVHEALEPYHLSDDRGPSLRLLDNTDPSTIFRAMKGLKAQETLTIVVSKSGNTMETLALLAFVHDWYTTSGQTIARHMVCITEENAGGLRSYAKEHGCPVFFTPPNVGGRFSVLSVCGLLPAALLGYDVRQLVEGARSYRERIAKAKWLDNPAYLQAGIHTTLMPRGKRVSVFMPYASRLDSFGDWYAQLWCESLGKARDRTGKLGQFGQSVCVAVGASAQHSMLQLFLEGDAHHLITLLRVEEFESHISFPASPALHTPGLDTMAGKPLETIIHAQCEGTRQALSEKGRPNLSLNLPDLTEPTLGELLYHYELTTAYAGLLLGVNPYDQPAVERGKQLTVDMLANEV